MTTELNLTRLGHFIKRQLYMNLSAMWVAIAAVTGILLVVSGFVAYFNPDDVRNLIPFYLVVFFLGGYIFTSMIFNEMHSPQKSYAFLTLPVSTAEKLVGAWVIVAPVYLITAVASMFILGAASSWVAGEPVALPGLLGKNAFKILGIFLVCQTIFFLGATAFKGNNFLKTLLALFVFFTLWAMYTGGVGYILFGANGSGVNHGFSHEFKNLMEAFVKHILPFLFWFVLPLYLLVVSYFKLKERQV
ncbi:hypothetical protein [Pontibacter oryzae]|uniref:Uncharacterized protein n=1 Tax=Pontibacter oryzae TaxID=2304593 RepID=A0A399S3I5_9BACT|nr:hypothetical protein [Pontibacter oryzae]RIJ36622.1 hypothetical protein D1627_12275 [Pontibacter oryzae]